MLTLRSRHLGNKGGYPCRPLAIMSVSMLALSALFMLGPAASWFGLATLPTWYLGIVALLSALYLFVVTALKRAYLSRTGNLF